MGTRCLKLEARPVKGMREGGAGDLWGVSELKHRRTTVTVQQAGPFSHGIKIQWSLGSGASCAPENCWRSDLFENQIYWSPGRWVTHHRELSGENRDLEFCWTSEAFFLEQLGQGLNCSRTKTFENRGLTVFVQQSTNGRCSGKGLWGREKHKPRPCPKPLSQHLAFSSAHVNPATHFCQMNEDLQFYEGHVRKQGTAGITIGTRQN